MRKIITSAVVLFLTVLSALHGLGQQTDNTMDLYLLIGQSNMSGRGPITDQFKAEGNDHVLMLDKAGNWVQAKHPLHFDKPSVAGVGPGLCFGIAMQKKNHGKTVGLIPCAVGGTAIDVWKPGAYDKATDTHPYDDAVKRLAIAMQSGKLKGVLWLQGESDSDSSKAKNYLPKLIELIARIREIATDTNLPFVVGELGRYKDTYRYINDELHKLPELVQHTAVASSRGFKDKGDLTHFDSKSADAYGKRFAKKMKQLQKN
ncbi:MAG: sialate O-acetylesterase [Chitinophagaceae bacterium]